MSQRPSGRLQSPAGVRLAYDLLSNQQRFGDRCLLYPLPPLDRRSPRHLAAWNPAPTSQLLFPAYRGDAGVLHLTYFLAVAEPVQVRNRRQGTWPGTGFVFEADLSRHPEPTRPTLFPPCLSWCLCYPACNHKSGWSLDRTRTFSIYFHYIFRTPPSQAEQGKSSVHGPEEPPLLSIHHHPPPPTTTHHYAVSCPLPSYYCRCISLLKHMQPS